MGNFKVHTTFNKSFSQTAPSALKCPKTEFWDPLTNWKLNPLHGPTHMSDPSTNINKHTEQAKKLCVDLSWHALNSMIYASQNFLSHWKARIWLSHGFQKKKFQTHPLKPAEVNLSFRKVSLLPPAKTKYAFPCSPPRLESFGHKCTSSHTPWTEASVYSS